MVIDMPDANLPYAQVMVAKTSAGQEKDVRTTGVCQAIPNYPGVRISGDHGIGPAASASNYFFDYEKKNISEKGAITTFIRMPTHGKIDDEGNGAFSYVPDRGFHGKDSAVAVVDIAGYKVKVVYSFVVVNDDLGDDWISRYCRKTGYQWKISSKSRGQVLQSSKFINPKPLALDPPHPHP